MFLSTCQVLWMIHEFYVFITFIRKEPITNCSILNMERKMAFGPTSWEIKVAHFCLGSWFFTNKMQTSVTHIILEMYFNRQMSRERNVVKNAFGILKKTFKKLSKSKLHIFFLHDDFRCYWVRVHTKEPPPTGLFYKKHNEVF
jgi:hypothetical protein